MRTATTTIFAAVAALLAGCAPTARHDVSSAAEAVPAGEVAVAAQGWDDKQRWEWYRASQGSRLLPAAWLAALETPEGGRPFLAPEHMAGFGYLPIDARLARFDAAKKIDPRLPIGFTIDAQSDAKLVRTQLRWFKGQGSRERWVGMNCSACHTGEVGTGAQAIRVDGAPGMGDFQRVVESIDSSLARTEADPARFDRFAGAVLAGRDTAENRAKLKNALAALNAWERQIDAANETPMRYGPARLDAVGHILNRTAIFAAGAAATPNPSDAPVSYPFIWNIHQHDRLQWNGMASTTKVGPRGRKFDYGAMGRNAGQVIGVFGEVVASKSRMGFVSSVDVPNLGSLEKRLEKLHSPAWPVAQFGALDAALVARGRSLFGSKGCVDCHKPLDRTDLTTPIVAQMALFREGIAGNKPPGTDPWMACNAFDRLSATGMLEGFKPGYLPIGSDAAFGPVEPIRRMLTTTVTAVLVRQAGRIASSGLGTFIGGERPPEVVSAQEGVDDRAERLARCMSFVETSARPILGYKARPLNGIWATAPYLHNGSVPTLDALLLPPDQRPARFMTGTRAFDPVRVGFEGGAGAAGNVFTLVARSPEGRPVDGNSNAGHDYGNSGITADERRALVEYMKSL